MKNEGFNQKLSPSKQCDAQDAIGSVLFDIAHEHGGLAGFQEANPDATYADYLNWATGEALTVALVHLKKYSARATREGSEEFWLHLQACVAKVVGLEGRDAEEKAAEAARDILLLVAKEYVPEMVA